MNIQNIAILADQLASLGIENSGYPLTKRICFKPDRFSLSQRIKKGKDQLNIQLFFEKDRKQHEYVLMYYDAILQKDMALAETTVNGINTSILENQIAGIDWRKAFELDEKKEWNVENKLCWETEQKIEAIVEDLATLDKVEEGKVIAMNLKHKYWAAVPHQELFGSISPCKSKTEVSQRFYFPEGQDGISVEEAYRFLQNRWLEKQMQINRMKADDLHGKEMLNGNDASISNVLLRKRRSNFARRSKK